MSATLAATRGHRRLIIAPNADPGCEGIRAAFEAEEECEVIDHLPRPRWLGLLAGCRAIVGNSSAGLIEAAVLGAACVNIGPRQSGRERAENVIDCDYGEHNVREALGKALALDLSSSRHPYGDGRAGQRIAEHLATIDLDHLPLHKRNRY